MMTIKIFFSSREQHLLAQIFHFPWKRSLITLFCFVLFFEFQALYAWTWGELSTALLMKPMVWHVLAYEGRSEIRTLLKLMAKLGLKQNIIPYMHSFVSTNCLFLTTGCFPSSRFCASFSQSPITAKTAKAKDLQGDACLPIVQFSP